MHIVLVPKEMHRPQFLMCHPSRAQSCCFGRQDVSLVSLMAVTSGGHRTLPFVTTCWPVARTVFNHQLSFCYAYLCVIILRLWIRKGHDKIVHFYIVHLNIFQFDLKRKSHTFFFCELGKDGADGDRFVNWAFFWVKCFCPGCQLTFSPKIEVFPTCVSECIVEPAKVGADIFLTLCGLLGLWVPFCRKASKLRMLCFRSGGSADSVLTLRFSLYGNCLGFPGVSVQGRVSLD